ncbi:MAG TPA: hypothetical protein PKY77_25385 [Phycisphaerae bacterium]|nr:hypothetical protein [Phycisphaerae bacterium]HRY71208.1 hypothetical protein [Phycisphaerae bacterium]HSA29591.1 hypothetical protein [Phycisphaerae bacterium]
MNRLSDYLSLCRESCGGAPSKIDAGEVERLFAVEVVMQHFRRMGYAILSETHEPDGRIRLRVRA